MIHWKSNLERKDGHPAFGHGQHGTTMPCLITKTLAE